MPIRRLVFFSVPAFGLLAACAAPEPQPFAVTASAAPAPSGTLFRSTEANLDDVMAKGYCADGYQKLDEKTLPTSDGDLTEWQVQCKRHSYVLPF